MSLNAKSDSSPIPDALASELTALKSSVQELIAETRRSRRPEVSGALHDTYRKLVESAVAECIARDLVDKVRRELDGPHLRDPALVRQALARGVEAMLPVAGPIRLADSEASTTIAMVGPTGVGKTTTIAKLAAHFCLRDRLKVGLITIDTYRIAAVEQLKTYAQIIDIPLEIATTPDELRDAVARLSDRDIILIDTAGRSQRDQTKIHELREFFDAVPPNEIHLVLASTCSEKVLLETVQQFRKLDVDRVIFTKLDEAIGFGVMLACLQKAEAKLSYVTTGQDVPDDIHVGEGKALARLILGERTQRPAEELPVPAG